MFIKHSQRSSKNGNVLLSTILIMALVLNFSIVIAVLSLSHLGRINKIKSQSLSYYGAESGIENGLFKIRKGGQEISKLDKNVITAEGINWQVKGMNLSGEVFEDLEKDKSIVLYLYSPDTWQSGIDKLEINWSDTCNDASMMEIKLKYPIEEQADLDNIDWDPTKVQEVREYWRSEIEKTENDSFDLFLNNQTAYALKITAKFCYFNFFKIVGKKNAPTCDGGDTPGFACSTDNDCVGEGAVCTDIVPLNIENVITSTGSVGDVKQTIRVSM